MNIVKSLALVVLSCACTLSVNAHTPFDLSIVNEEKVIAYLKRSGVLSDNASPEDIRKALDAYLSGDQPFDDGVFTKKNLENRQQILKRKTQLDAPKEKTKRFSFLRSVPNTRTDRVLAILIDFPDLPYDDNRLEPQHTDMFYDSYPAVHYQDLLFGDEYAGPNGETLITMRQYYEQESGGSYSVAGAVAGWYRAKHSSAYYGAHTDSGAKDANARDLVKEALDALVQDGSINLADYDNEDRYDVDGDGDYFEPDGIIDHLMIFHSSVGEEAGGGALGQDALWSHRWNLPAVYELEGTESGLSHWNGKYAAYDYTMQPIDAAAGVAAHEYGHDLGLPDEYDTQYSGEGEPVSSWSIMSSGAWAGKIPGSEPVAFSAWAKEFLYAQMGGNWLNAVTYSLDDLAGTTKTVRLAETVENDDGTNHVRINLPNKEIVEILPYAGEYQYYSGKGDDLHNSMSVEVTLPTAETISLSFDTHYDVEPDYDFARVLIDGEPISGNITTYDDPLGSGLVPAVHSYSKDHPDNVNGWVPAVFDLSAYSGQTVTLTFEYITDGGWVEQGFYADNILVIADGNTVLSDDAESDSTFAFNGYSKNDGNGYYAHYYMLQWRSHAGVDEGLKNLQRSGDRWQYEPGLVVWYADDSYSDNWVGQHPGKGWLGVVDADQFALTWTDLGESASTKYQIRDAVFSLQDQAPIEVSFDDIGTLIDDALNANPTFDDRSDYSNPEQPDAGRIVPQYGLSITVVEQAEDNHYGVVEITLDDDAPTASFSAAIEGNEVIFIDQSSDKEGAITQWAWDFGDGYRSSEQHPVHVYSQGGIYSVSLTVTDAFGQTNTDTQRVTLNVAPEADFDVIQVGKWALFISASTDSDGDINKYHWNFGDGRKAASSVGMVWHTYRKRGKYDVTHTVTDDLGGTDSETKKISVKKWKWWW
ncbi:immune inhibitor A domain-containing protein [Enterovibrio norvegicus]|uniref:Immune inhibitor A domain-containing protein n=1 Tax=Enterovibrio norvegicus TaxID=188144 RepID=A0ABV4KW63_9GAMM|nr:immune inhibitor A domain-containing protein [Enterovibrio norvegicus]OEF57064.1 protease [Enterovibrio norvegicus]